MRRKYFFVVVILVILAAFYLRGRFFDLPQVRELASDLAEIQKHISIPPPLRSVADAKESFLTREGVFTLINSERDRAGLQRLRQSTQLNQAAGKKISDMFARQYFAHVAPDGKDVSSWAASVGYDFIAIGENLALGNFADDADLVGAWMDSQGHRENILQQSYRETGIAVGQGNFEGKITWLAVQVFALPKSACPAPPSDSDKSRIDENKENLSRLENELAGPRQGIESARSKRGREYSDKINEYNELVTIYNDLTTRTQRLIDLYNSQAQAFNDCLKK